MHGDLSALWGQAIIERMVEQGEREAGQIDNLPYVTGCGMMSG